VTTKTEQLRRMRDIHARAGLRALLIYLNGLTGHRFTAVYRFDIDQLRSVTHDRECPEVESCPDIPVLASYCVFVRKSRHSFFTPDSLADEWTSDHPKRLEIRSYCGVPLVDGAGRVFGTICHFDPRPMPISEENVTLLESVASIVSLDPALGKGSVKRKAR
jgi:GAF domain-containing protein